MISYLPLAHCYEKWMHAIAFSRGTSIGYFRGDPLKLVADIQMLKPTVSAMVPRVLTKLYDAINMMMSQEEWKRKLYKVALKQKLSNIKNLKFTHLLWDSILFKYTKGLIGGRMRFMVTGSAPIAPDLLNIIK